MATQAGIPTTYRRNIAIERLEYEADGAIRQVTYTTGGVPPAHYADLCAYRGRDDGGAVRH